MRLFVAAVFFGALGCCLGPTTETPAPPPPSTSSPLSQALRDLGEAGASGATNTPPVATPPVPTTPTASPTTPPGAPPPAAPAAPDSAACTEARAAKKAVNDDLVQLRLTIGAETGQRVEQAAAAMKACTEDMACMRDPKARIARMEAYDRAKAAHDGETQRLATAELGLFEADKAVRAACGR